MSVSNTPRRKTHAAWIISLTCLLSIGYAILRYHVFGAVPWKDFPFFILNKGIALSAYILLAINFTLGPLNNLRFRLSERWLNSRKSVGMTGFLLVLAHVLISLLLFSKEVYGKFYETDGTLTLNAGLSMLSGVLAFIILWLIHMSFQTFMREDRRFIQLIASRSFLLIAFLLGASHLFFMGYKGWMDPSGWHGGLPPISLVAFAFFLLGFIINLFGRK
jgi:hypothetical protein